MLQNNAGKKKNVHVRLTPTNHTGLGIYDQDGIMRNEFADSNVFDAVLAEGEKIKVEIWAVRAKKSQFTLVITARDAVAIPTLSIPNPHRHPRGEDMLSSIEPDIKIVEAAFPSDRTKENVVENKTKTFRAFTMDAEGLERIFFEADRSKIFPMIGLQKRCQMAASKLSASAAASPWLGSRTARTSYCPERMRSIVLSMPGSSSTTRILGRGISRSPRLPGPPTGAR